jgi:pimeloyl-ACP methyl ester carboxylesterase
MDRNAVSQVVITPRGPIECARGGPALPIVVGVHGAPGGYDQIPALFPGFPSPAFGLLTWSRPGYLRTPLGIGPSFEQQADLLAALLDVLGVGEVALFAFSGGGPTAVHFAARHPHRTWALILESAVTQRRPWVRSRFLGSSAGNWLLNAAAGVRPQEVFGALLRTESGLDAERARDVIARALRDPTRAAVLHGWLRSASPAAWRRHGLANDAARIESLGALPLEAVSAPTLIIHGLADADVPVEDAERAARLVPAVELVRVRDGLHLLPLADNASEIAATREAFLRHHARATAGSGSRRVPGEGSHEHTAVHRRLRAGAHRD